LHEHSLTSFADALQTLKILNEAGFSAMFAGGCVRDRILKVIPKDFDIASIATPDEASELFNSKGYRVIPTGIEHGTITVVTNSGPVEITTLRRDVSTDGRHAVVDFKGATFETDAARRDFTINALFEDEKGEIHDFHHGLADISNRKLRFVGAPDLRIQEDYLRILRFFRFWSRLDFSADTAALAAIKTHATGLKKISQERITSELWGILSSPHAGVPLASMFDSGVLEVILPQSVKLAHNHRVILIDGESLPPTVRPWAQLCILLGVIDKKIWTKPQINDLTKKLRFSDRQSKLLSDILVGWQSLNSIPRKTSACLEFAAEIEHHGKEFTLLDFFAPLWSFFAKHANDTTSQDRLGWLVSTDVSFGERRRMPLPISGHDVTITCPNASGPMVGEALTKAKHAFYDGDWHTREEGLKFLAKIGLNKG